MTITDLIKPHLPYLRRFARALSGSQSSGDAYVIATLEAIVADQSILRTDIESRVALYALFLKVWSSAQIDGRREASDLADRTLERLTPKSRQAFILTTVENFAREDAALVMAVSPDDFDGLLDVAAREIAEQVATDVLIIEDEPIIAMDLESLVEGLGHRVTDVARTHKQAIAAIGVKRPGLILADIQLADGSSGLDAVNEILESFEVPVIFITAYPERLLTGLKPEPAFLITKPFQTNTLKAVISQALFFNDLAQKKAAA